MAAPQAYMIDRGDEVLGVPVAHHLVPLAPLKATLGPSLVAQLVTLDTATPRLVRSLPVTPPIALAGREWLGSQR